MGYYAQNPYEKPEPPRCLSCDEFKVEVNARFSSQVLWECRNPACEECPPKYQVIECSTCGEEYAYSEFCQNCTSIPLSCVDSLSESELSNNEIDIVFDIV